MGNDVPGEAGASVGDLTRRSESDVPAEEGAEVGDLTRRSQKIARSFSKLNEFRKRAAG